jgi:hypothetical protein
MPEAVVLVDVPFTPFVLTACPRIACAPVVVVPTTPDVELDVPRTPVPDVEIPETPAFDDDVPNTPTPRTDVPLTPLSKIPLVDKS